MCIRDSEEGAPGALEPRRLSPEERRRLMERCDPPWGGEGAGEPVRRGRRTVRRVVMMTGAP
eukprot:523793-Pyramimonas_sp.AAC.1